MPVAFPVLAVFYGPANVALLALPLGIYFVVYILIGLVERDCRRRNLFSCFGADHPEASERNDLMY